jgi:hypothetical protein
MTGSWPLLSPLRDDELRGAYLIRAPRGTGNGSRIFLSRTEAGKKRDWLTSRLQFRVCGAISIEPTEVNGFREVAQACIFKIASDF